MRKLTEEEKRKLRGKAEEARTDRVVRMARQLESGLAGHRAISWRVMGYACAIPPLGIIIGIVLCRKSYKREGVYVLAGSVVVSLFYALFYFYSNLG